MNAKRPDLKKLYGDEYPAAAVVNGVRLPLSRETRFVRSYYSPQHKLGTDISRFMDGSASIRFSELQKAWPKWGEDLRSDFCNAACWLHDQQDFPEMLRFILKRGEHTHRSSVALSVSSCLPRNEAFEILVHALRKTEIGCTANISQAISTTKHPRAEATLRDHPASIWLHPGLWADAEFVNWIGFDAITCI